MKEESNILSELVKAKENIKRKYIALKTGEANVQQLMAQTFKPIIDPLTKISNTHDLSNKKNKKTTNNQENELTNSIDSYINKNNKTNDSNNDDIDYQQQIENWFQSLDIDRTYGPKKHENGDITLGNKEIKFIKNAIFIGDSIHPSTSGLIQLLFMKNPLIYTDNDLKTYKSILVQTSAHLTLDGVTIKKRGNKYYNIISKLFPSGGELFMKLQKNNLVYWNDPNELVVRLRLLLASKEAGNTSVSNEILSIFEELLEAGLIKRIPNV